MGGSYSQQPLVLLDRMPQQAEVRIVDDDWTGRTDAAERRKLQNRLHQRTYRRRRKLLKSKEHCNSQVISGPSLEEETFGVNSDPYPNEDQFASEFPPHNQRYEVFSRPDQLPGPPSRQASTTSGLTLSQIQDVINRFEMSLSQEYMLGFPRADLLLTLVQFNVFRALVGNSIALGFTFEWLSGDVISPFNEKDPNEHDWRCPPNLRSTSLQRTVIHHPWIDLFPIPTLRDNLLCRGEDFDDEALCHDLVEICHAPSERSGLINWGEPWDARSWEVTEDFARKWAWMLRGCRELLQSTNYWREKRGEEELVFDISFLEPPYE